METRNCQNCKNDFEITPDDFGFYEKIKVPPPTWCPECRAVRRLSFRNTRSLYRRDCDLCKRNITAMYHADDPAPVYCNTCWNGDGWDIYAHATDIDWSKPFFVQWYELYKKVPRFSAWHTQPLVNSEYTNVAVNVKNCYLTYSVTSSEDIRYSENTDKCKQCLDSLYLTECEQCYECIDGFKNYNSSYVVQSKNCMDSWFLFDCANCSNCFMSSNLRNKSYVFNNQQLSKDEYIRKISELKTTNESELQALREEFAGLCKSAIHRYADVISSDNSTGNHIINSKNIRNSYGVVNSENIKNSIRVIDHSKDSQDVYGMASGELVYDCATVSYNVHNTAFSLMCNNGIIDTFYSAYCVGVSNVFGCVGLKKTSYCILNKQYTKEEYEKFVPKIIEHMNTMPYIDAKGRVYKYGEFFPVEFSLYYLNETIAFDLYSPTKDKAIDEGYVWKVPDPKEYQISIEVKDLPDSISDVVDDITAEIIGCAHGQNCEHQCTKGFRILPDDLAFYRKHKLPLPRLCVNCRHYERLAKREPAKLWHRKCMKDGCTNEFETSYAPDRPEKVYCERCYQQEVY